MVAGLKSTFRLVKKACIASMPRAHVTEMGWLFELDDLGIDG
jgi:hypothetical protein